MARLQEIVQSKKFQKRGIRITALVQGIHEIFPGMFYIALVIHVSGRLIKFCICLKRSTKMIKSSRKCLTTEGKINFKNLV